MSYKKRILAIAAVICVLSGSMAYAEYDPDKVIDPTNPIMTLSAGDDAEDAPIVNGATLPSVSVKDVNGTKMIPLRSVAEGLGYTVTWKGESRSIDLVKGAQFITMSIDKDEYAFSRRAPQPLGTAPTLIGDSTYVPLSFVSEIIDGYAEENEDGTYKIVNPSIVTVKEITEEGSLVVEDNNLGTVVVHIGEDTVILAGGKEAKAEDIHAEMVLGIEYSPAMTASLPPQTTAVKILIENLPVNIEDETEEQKTFEFNGTITEIDENLVTIGTPHEDENALRLVITDNTVISRGKDKRIYKLDDLEVGMEISGTHEEAMTFSIPPQTVALTVEIKNTESVDDSEEYVTAEGVISEIIEDQVIIKNDDNDRFGFALNITDETVIKKGNDKRIYKIDDLKIGMKLSVKRGPETTKSLPPQAVAYEINILD